MGIYKQNKILIYLALFCGIIIILFWWLYPNKQTFEMFKFTDDDDFRVHQPVMYCGYLDGAGGIPVEYDIIGTRHKCLRKGVGVGMNMPDPKVAEFLAKPYVAPPHGQKIYCGDREVLPDDSYLRFGTKPECMRKGVGIGMSMPVEKRRAMQARPLQPLGKIELMNLANRLKITTDDKTRQQTRVAIAHQLA